MMGNEGVAAVEKALSLLDSFKPGTESLSLAELSLSSGMHKTTVYRLMNSLERMSYVTRSEAGRYSLGSRVLYLGKLYEQSFHLSSVVEPILQRLAGAAQESASYYVFENGQRLCLFRKEPSEGLRETRLPGTSLPIDDAAISLVLRYWQLKEPVFPHPPRLPLYTSGARDEHIAGFATPIFGEGDLFKAAMSLTGVRSRLDAAHATGALNRLQLDAAFELSRKLGASTAFCEKLYG